MFWQTPAGLSGVSLSAVGSSWVSFHTTLCFAVVCVPFCTIRTILRCNICSTFHLCPLPGRLATVSWALNLLDNNVNRGQRTIKVSRDELLALSLSMLGYDLLSVSVSLSTDLVMTEISHQPLNGLYMPMKFGQHTHVPLRMNCDMVSAVVIYCHHQVNIFSLFLWPKTGKNNAVPISLGCTGEHK